MMFWVLSLATLLLLQTGVQQTTAKEWCEKTKVPADVTSTYQKVKDGKLSYAVYYLHFSFGSRVKDQYELYAEQIVVMETGPVGGTFEQLAASLQKNTETERDFLAVVVVNPRVMVNEDEDPVMFLWIPEKTKNRAWLKTLIHSQCGTWVADKFPGLQCFRNTVGEPGDVTWENVNRLCAQNI